MKEAQAYAAHGVALVPIPLGKKGPVVPGWNEPSQAITDPAIAAALTGNIGIAHAYSTPRCAALDVDDLAFAIPMLAQHGIDLQALLDADDSVVISSGRPNHTKLLFRLHDDLPSFASKVCKQDGKTIFELRCATADGRTVQDVLPPSIHPDTGQPYRWAGNGHWSRLPLLPIAVVDLWESITQRKAQSTDAAISSSLGPMPDYLRARLK
ncbi:bifunctional DNA primase/polymerase, partial [Rhodoferax sp.]|uniref:bifunctional DNA primase/polymerase n=1 Tax=Rhodoferax sp. TaxID=50421 RepID=UPI0025FB26B7